MPNSKTPTQQSPGYYFLLRVDLNDEWFSDFFRYFPEISFFSRNILGREKPKLFTPQKSRLDVFRVFREIQVQGRRKSGNPTAQAVPPLARHRADRGRS